MADHTLMILTKMGAGYGRWERTLARPVRLQPGESIRLVTDEKRMTPIGIMHSGQFTPFLSSDEVTESMADDTPDPDLQGMVEAMAPADSMDAIEARGWFCVATQWVGKRAHAAIQVDEPPNDRTYSAHGATVDEAVAGAYAVAVAIEDVITPPPRPAAQPRA